MLWATESTRTSVLPISSYFILRLLRYHLVFGQVTVFGNKCTISSFRDNPYHRVGRHSYIRHVGG